MLEAWDNRYQRSLTVGDYVAAYGPRSDVRYRPAFRPKLRCLVCSGTLHTVHEGSPSAQWVHDPNPARKCSARHPIPILQRLPDSRGAYSEAAVSLRAAFFRNWGRHWSRARKLCRNATIIRGVRHRGGPSRALGASWSSRRIRAVHLPGGRRLPRTRLPRHGLCATLAPVRVRLANRVTV